jgi:hypothetical protein
LLADGRGSVLKPGATRGRGAERAQDGEDEGHEGQRDGGEGRDGGSRGYGVPPGVRVRASVTAFAG